MIQRVHDMIGRTATTLLKSSITNTRQKITYPRTNKPQIESMLITIAPGGQSSWHLHPVPTFVYVLQGTVLVQNKGTPSIRYRAGTAFLEATNTWHNAKNHGKRPLKLLLVYAGEQGKPNLIRPDK